MTLKDKLLAQRRQNKLVEFRIPKESFEIIEATDSEGKQVHLMINVTLRNIKNDNRIKQAFGYCCTINFDYCDVDDNLIPTSEEFSIMLDYVRSIDKALKVNDDYPNAILVAVVSYKGTCQVTWMLYNPLTAIKYLDDIITKGKPVREFEYDIQGDSKWGCIDWLLQDFPLEDQK